MNKRFAFFPGCLIPARHPAMEFAIRHTMTNLDILAEHDHALIRRAAELGEEIKGWLSEGAAESGLIGDVRGRGLMIGIEMVKDKQTKAPLDEAAMGKIIFGLLKRGVIMVPCGRYGNVFRFMPPLTITREYCRKASEILLEVVKKL